ncbi:MAG: helix-turn-helix transcriptional regulator [Planctomycetia bacterium]|nr:helix-turn-helix transcriptional regulator [Planctomycetia bacterium]
MTFADKLKALRVEKDLTQEQLAEAAGIPIGTLRDYEQGKRRADPALSTAVKLARALGVSVEAFAECVEAEHEKPARRPKPSGKPALKRRRKD